MRKRFRTWYRTYWSLTSRNSSRNVRLRMNGKKSQNERSTSVVVVRAFLPRKSSRKWRISSPDDSVKGSVLLTTSPSQNARLLMVVTHTESWNESETHSKRRTSRVLLLNSVSQLRAWIGREVVRSVLGNCHVDDHQLSLSSKTLQKSRSQLTWSMAHRKSTLMNQSWLNENNWYNFLRNTYRRMVNVHPPHWNSTNLSSWSARVHLEK